MDQKKFEEVCYSLGQCVKHAEAKSADKRTQLVESKEQPLVLIKYYAKPMTCVDCGKDKPDRISQTHTFKGVGWKSWCDMCKLSRQPGTDYFGLKRPVETQEPEVIVPEPLPKPKPQQHSEPQSVTIENVPISDSGVGFVGQVIVKDYHESVIREFVRTPAIPPLDASGVQEPDNAIHTD